ncbi:hypothetical protein AD930_06715 [Acetobacter malorum]|nr:hypothetical protein AD930_06715 [Acetobacter malorum]
MRQISTVQVKNLFRSFAFFFVFPISFSLIVILTLLLGLSFAGADRGVFRPDVEGHLRAFGVILLGFSSCCFLVIKSKFGILFPSSDNDI